jgi:hypothetical protein
MRRGLAAVALAVTAMVAAGVAPVGAVGHAPIRHAHGYPLPDRHATPGKVARHAPPRKFCRSGYSARHRDVSESLRERVFAEYGISYAKHRHFEVDHLIPLELGGANGIKNLWPEHGRIPNPKDGVENRLHNLVCQHHLGVHKARHVIARNWVRAMKRYGATSYVYVRPAHHHGGGGSSHACTRTTTGKCIQRGWFCRQADYGQYGYDAAGDRLQCTGDRTHPRWE